MSNINEKINEAEAAAKPMAARIEYDLVENDRHSHAVPVKPLSTLALQIHAAVAAKVEPLEVEVMDGTEYGNAVMVGVVGIKEVFGYRRLMPDGTRNLHTPESFADALAGIVEQHVSRMIAAQAKRDARASKRSRA